MNDSPIVTTKGLFGNTSATKMLPNCVFVTKILFYYHPFSYFCKKAELYGNKEETPKVGTGTRLERPR